MLAGLEHISAGDISFGGQRVNDLPPKDRDIAMVFENYALYPHKTVFENMANPLRLRGHRCRARSSARSRKAAELLEISHLLERRPVELSGGQKQRTAIGRAIVREPKLFLFDEPIAHLDAKLRAHMRGELKIMQRELGTTMIYVTHDQLEALSMADRIAVMHDGVLQQFGTPREIYDHPGQRVGGGLRRRAADELPRLHARGAGRSSCMSSIAAFAVPVTAQQRTAMLNGEGSARQVRLAMRPAEIAIVPPGVDGAVKANILVTEPLGGDMLVDCALGDNKVLVKTRPDFAGVRGEECWLTFDTARWHLFARTPGWPTSDRPAAGQPMTIDAFRTGRARRAAEP